MVSEKALNDYNRLREEVCQCFGRRISSHSDSVDLSSQTGLSTQTIKRFFGLIRGNTRPSKETLDTLCRFVNYRSWDSFVDPSSLQLRTTLLRKGVKGNMDFYRDDIPEYWEIFFNKSRDNASQIYAMPDGEDKCSLFKELGGMSTAHDTFWEWFPNMNVLCRDYYRDGLISYRDSKDTSNAHAFANGMLFLGSYLAKDADGMKVSADLLSVAKMRTGVWPLPAARMSAALFLYNHENGSASDDMRMALINEFVLQQDSPDNRYTNSYGSILIEYLLVGGFATLIAELLPKGRYYAFGYSEFFASSVHYHSVRTVEALALFVAGRKEESRVVFESIKPERFGFNESLYYGCFYTIVAILHGRLESEDELYKLVAKTGYVRFYDLLKLYKAL